MYSQLYYLRTNICRAYMTFNVRPKNGRAVFCSLRNQGVEEAGLRTGSLFSYIVHQTAFYFLFKDIFNECLSRPCQNGGSCENLLGDYRCNCTSGFTGRQCDIGMYYCISLLTLKALRVISIKFLLVISMLCKTEWSGELRT